MTTQERPQARFVKPGEMLAMDPSRIHRGPQGFFWLFGDGPKPNERRGDVAIVHIRGELEHHKDMWGGGESYEGILERFQAALSGQDCADQHAAEHGAEADYKPIDATPPSCVILCIDSPGGVVAGLNETVKALRKMKAEAKIPVYVFVNEMAASAAYALATVGDEIICPRSAILGSIGVISTMISQAKKNAKDGYDVRLLTSGARKADGHLHAPISDDAVKVEMDRVEKLAASFFKLVSKARGLSVEKIESYEAGIFLGPDAVKRGLADSIMSFDDLLLGASETASSGETNPAEAGGNETDRRVRSVAKVSISKHSTEAPMPLALSALIKKTEAAIAKEKDPRKLASLVSALEAYKKTKHTIEKHESESGDDDEGDEDKDEGDDEDEDEDEESESKSKSAASPMKDDEEDEEEEEEESEEESAKAALALVNQITGMKGKKALGALQALAATAANTAKDVAALKKAHRASAKATLIEGARAKGQITKAEATFLAGQKVSTVEGFVAMRQKSGFVHTDEGTMAKPKHVQPGTEESLPKEAREMIDAAVANYPGDKKAFRAQLVSAHLESHTKHVSAVLSGANGRI